MPSTGSSTSRTCTRATRSSWRTSTGPKVTPHIFIFDRERKLRYEGRIDDNMRGNNIKSTTPATPSTRCSPGAPVPVEHTPVFGCSTKWNSAIAGKQKEMKEWMAQPVTLETVSLDELKKLRTNPTGKTLMINFWATWCGPCQTEYPELLTSVSRGTAAAISSSSASR